MITGAASSVEALREDLAGGVTLPGDPVWDAARRAWNLAVDQRPVAVSEVASADDVAAVVRFARAGGLRVAPQGTGHGAGSLGPRDGTILLRTARLRDVAIDPATRVARLGAGVLAEEVARAAGAHGLAPVLGLAPTVGVTGLTLGGGIGWLGRAHGLGANSVLAVELVTGTGEHMRVDAERDPELFWALRGGAGGFGVVTALELRLHAVPQAFGGRLVWPGDRMPDVLETFRRWTADAPETLSAVFRHVVPPVGSPVVMVAAVYLGSPEDGARMLRPLRAAGTAVADSFGPVGPADLVRVAGDPEEPSAAVRHGLAIEDLTADAVRALTAGLWTGDLAALRVLEVRQLGGALARPPEGHGALSHVPGRFSVLATGDASDADRAAAGEGGLRTLDRIMRPWAAERPLLSFAGLGVAAEKAFDAASWERLRAVCARVDPDGVLATRDPGGRVEG